MANSVGSSDPSTKVDNESTTGQANANEWGNAPAGPVDAFGFPLDSNQKTVDTAAGALAAKELPAQEPYAEAPPAVAPADLPELKLRGNCVILMTDPEGNLDTIGRLWNSGSPACLIQLNRLTENRETSLSLCAHFPRFRYATEEQFQRRIWFQFYGDAFENFESDFVITKVNGYKELPDVLTYHISVVCALGKDLHKLQWTYKPEKVVTKAKDDPYDFLIPESSYEAQLFRDLVEGETPKTLTLYFLADPATLHALNAIRDRLEYEMIVKPSVEYRNKNGKIVRQRSYKTAKAA
ncbi:hypothetical protein JMJ35_002856 [Cladonia borealis]|uniref:Uncharacterized protein n=1 Tax=Cladonia borealis TaxID=184061 RepID=A0AA39R5P9_9LECA|nr:hypothetical protein JMJ35_002856 [Cladonia borealis]